MMKLVSKVSFLCLTQECFFFTVLVQYLMNKGLTSADIAYFLMIKKIAKILTEIPFGILFDKFNAKIIFLISRIFKISSMVIIFYFPDKNSLIIASILGGMAMSSLFSKIDVYIYNNLEEKGQTSLFPKAVSLYYFITDFSMVGMYYFSSFLIDNTSYFNILILSIVFVSLSFPVIFTININNIKKNLEGTYDFKDKFQYLKDQFNKIKKEFRKKEIILPILILGLLNGLIWQIIGIVNIILKFHQKNIALFTDSNIAKISSLIYFFMSIGSFITIFVRKFKLTTGLKVGLLTLTALALSAFNLNSFLIMIFVMMVLYTFIEICVERFLDERVERNLRATCFSVVAIFLSISQIINYGIFGKMSKIVQPQYGLIVILVLYVVFLIGSLIALKKE